MKNISITLVSLATLLISVACVGLNESDERKTASTEVSTSCTTATRTQLTRGQNLQKKEISLAKTLQKVITRGCHGKILSQSIEIVTQDLPELTIVAENLPESYLSFQHQTQNRTTCSSHQQTFESGVNEMQFAIDTETSENTLQVTSGKNYIDYKFFGPCNSESCQNREVRESGTLVLNVTYTETMIDEVKEESACDIVALNN